MDDFAKNFKKGVIGSTMTWFVATFVIIFILIIYFIFVITSYGGRTEKVYSYSYSSDVFFNYKEFISSFNKHITAGTSVLDTSEVIVSSVNSLDEDSMMYADGVYYSLRGNSKEALEDISKPLTEEAIFNLVEKNQPYNCGDNQCFSELLITSGDKSFVEYKKRASGDPEIKTIETYYVYLPYKKGILNISLSRYYYDYSDRAGGI